VKIDKLLETKKILRKHSCTHLLITDVTDIRSLSSFHSTSAIVLISKRKHILFTDFRYRSSAKKLEQKGTWKFVEIQTRGYKFLKDYLGKNAVVGIQSDKMTVEQFQELKKALGGTPLRKIGSSLEDVLLQKNPVELRNIRKSAAIAVQSLHIVMKKIRSGMTEIELAAELDYQCRLQGASKASFDTIVLFGARSALPHGKASPVKLKQGDFILIDFGCVYKGMCSDMTRTFVLGTAGKKQKAVYDLVLHAQESACEKIKAGLKCAAADAIARGIITEAGYGELFGHGLGHGVGYRIHEQPTLSKLSKLTLQENDVVTVEPGIYLPRFGGVRIEDMVLVKKNCAEILTPFPKKLHELRG